MTSTDPGVAVAVSEAILQESQVRLLNCRSEGMWLDCACGR